MKVDCRVLPKAPTEFDKTRLSHGAAGTTRLLPIDRGGKAAQIQLCHGQATHYERDQADCRSKWRGAACPWSRGFFQETGINYHEWIGKIWARWGDALREAGFEPNKLQTAYNDDILIEKFIGLARELRPFPVYAEIRMKARNEDGFPAHNTFARLGSKEQLVAKILAYCKNRAGYEDVIALCSPIAEYEQSQSTGSPVSPATATKEGYVYLGC